MLNAQDRSQSESTPHTHNFRYYACVNLWDNGEVTGVIDVWRCVDCHAKGIELRAQDLNNLAAETGFPILDGPDSNWIVFVCKAQEQIKYEVLLARVGDVIEHQCIESTGQIKVGEGYKLANAKDGYHKIQSIEPYLNETMDLAA